VASLQLLHSTLIQGGNSSRKWGKVAVIMQGDEQLYCRSTLPRMGVLYAFSLHDPVSFRPL